MAEDKTAKREAERMAKTFGKFGPNFVGNLVPQSSTTPSASSPGQASPDVLEQYRFHPNTTTAPEDISSLQQEIKGRYKLAKPASPDITKQYEITNPSSAKDYKTHNTTNASFIRTFAGSSSEDSDQEDEALAQYKINPQTDAGGLTAPTNRERSHSAGSFMRTFGSDTTDPGKNKTDDEVGLAKYKVSNPTPAPSKEVPVPKVGQTGERKKTGADMMFMKYFEEMNPTAPTQDATIPAVVPASAGRSSSGNDKKAAEDKKKMQEEKKKVEAEKGKLEEEIKELEKEIRKMSDLKKQKEDRLRILKSMKF